MSDLTPPTPAAWNDPQNAPMPVGGVAPGDGPTPDPTAGPYGYAPPVTAPPTGGCQVCGRGPATNITATQQTGLLLARQTSKWEGRACRDCGTALVRKATAHNLVAGWWGIVSLVTNPFTLAGNVKAGRALRKLAAPEGPPLAQPMDPGRPTWQKPWVWLAPVVIVACIVGVIVSGANHTSVTSLSAGDCLDYPEGTSFTQTDDADCTGPHDAEVTGLTETAAMGDDVHPCETNARDYLGGEKGLERYRFNWIVLDSGGSVCVVESATGGKLTEPAQGSGR